MVERQRMKVASSRDEQEHKKNGAQQSMVPSPGADSTASKQASSSWASVAKKSKSSMSSNTGVTESLSTITKSTNDSGTTAKTGGAANNYSQIVQQLKEASKDNGTNTMISVGEENGSDLPSPEEAATEMEEKVTPALPQSSNPVPDGPAVLSQVTPSSVDDDCISGINKLASTTISSTSIPQGSNDVFEVLCSGELTSGKLLMHFLLFYGQHFDAASTLVDINGSHHPQYGMINSERLSPFVSRPPGGTIDPVTGMFSVDTIVVYDPLEGAMEHNVAKRCYCWNNVRWVFAQCYMTVSSIVETSDAMMGGVKKSSVKTARAGGDKLGNNNKSKEEQRQQLRSTTAGVDAADVVTPILELLLSF